MANILHVCLLEQQWRLRVVATRSQRHVRRHHYITPVTSHKATGFIVFFTARGITGEGAVGCSVSGKTLLESNSSHSPLLVVIVMDYWSTRSQEHIVIPIHKILSKIVALFVEISHFLVPKLFDVEGDFYCLRK